MAYPAGDAGLASPFGEQCHVGNPLSKHDQLELRIHPIASPEVR